MSYSRAIVKQHANDYIITEEMHEIEEYREHTENTLAIPQYSMRS